MDFLAGRGWVGDAFSAICACLAQGVISAAWQGQREMGSDLWLEESEGKAKWEDGMRLLLMEGKTRKIQVSGSICVGCGREKASSKTAAGREPAGCWMLG